MTKLVDFPSQPTSIRIGNMCTCIAYRLLHPGDLVQDRIEVSQDDCRRTRHDKSVLKPGALPSFLLLTCRTEKQSPFLSFRHSPARKDVKRLQAINRSRSLVESTRALGIAV